MKFGIFCLIPWREGRDVNQVYRENLERMIDLSARKGFRLALFLQPIMGVDGKPLSAEEREIFPRVPDLSQRRAFYRDARVMFAGLARRERNPRLCVTDLSTAFENVPQTVYADHGHLRPEGNRRITGSMAEALRRCRLLP